MKSSSTSFVFSILAYNVAASYFRRTSSNLPPFQYQALSNYASIGRSTPNFAPYSAMPPITQPQIYGQVEGSSVSRESLPIRTVPQPTADNHVMMHQTLLYESDAVVEASNVQDDLRPVTVDSSVATTMPNTNSIESHSPTQGTISSSDTPESLEEVFKILTGLCFTEVKIKQAILLFFLTHSTVALSKSKYADKSINSMKRLNQRLSEAMIFYRREHEIFPCDPGVEGAKKYFVQIVRQNADYFKTKTEFLDELLAEIEKAKNSAFVFNEKAADNHLLDTLKSYGHKDFEIGYGLAFARSIMFGKQQLPEYEISRQWFVKQVREHIMMNVRDVHKKFKVRYCDAVLYFVNFMTKKVAMNNEFGSQTHKIDDTDALNYNYDLYGRDQGNNPIFDQNEREYPDSSADSVYEQAVSSPPNYQQQQQTYNCIDRYDVYEQAVPSPPNYQQQQQTHYFIDRYYVHEQAVPSPPNYQQQQQTYNFIDILTTNNNVLQNSSAHPLDAFPTSTTTTREANSRKRPLEDATADDRRKKIPRQSYSLEATPKTPSENVGGSLEVTPAMPNIQENTENLLDQSAPESLEVLFTGLTGIKSTESKIKQAILFFFLTNSTVALSQPLEPINCINSKDVFNKCLRNAARWYRREKNIFPYDKSVVEFEKYYLEFVENNAEYIKSNQDCLGKLLEEIKVANDRVRSTDNNAADTLLLKTLNSYGHKCKAADAGRALARSLMIETAKNRGQLSESTFISGVKNHFKKVAACIPAKYTVTYYDAVTYFVNFMKDKYVNSSSNDQGAAQNNGGAH
jgi:hypothetical protein